MYLEALNHLVATLAFQLNCAF